MIVRFQEGKWQILNISRDEIQVLDRKSRIRLVSDFSTAYIEARRQCCLQNAKRGKKVSNQFSKCQLGLKETKTFSKIPGVQSCAYNAPFLRKLMKHVLLQNEGINQEDMRNKNRGLIQETEPTGIP